MSIKHLTGVSRFLGENTLKMPQASADISPVGWPNPVIINATAEHKFAILIETKGATLIAFTTKNTQAGQWNLLSSDGTVIESFSFPASVGDTWVQQYIYMESTYEGMTSTDPDGNSVFYLASTVAFSEIQFDGQKLANNGVIREVRSFEGLQRFNPMGRASTSTLKRIYLDQVEGYDWTNAFTNERSLQSLTLRHKSPKELIVLDIASHAGSATLAMADTSEVVVGMQVQAVKTSAGWINDALSDNPVTFISANSALTVKRALTAGTGYKVAIGARLDNFLSSAQQLKYLDIDVGGVASAVGAFYGVTLRALNWYRQIGLAANFANYARFETVSFSADILNGSGMFAQCSGLQFAGISKVSNSDSMFLACSSLVSTLGINTKDSESANFMFSGCGLLKYTGTARFDSAKSVDNTFNACNSLEAAALYAPQATTVNGCFSYCTALKAVDRVDAPLASNATFLFNGCMALTMVRYLEVADGCDASSIFYECRALQDVLAGNLKPLNLTQGFANTFALQKIPRMLDLSAAETLINAFTGSGLSGSVSVDTSARNLSDMFLLCNNITTLSVTGNQIETVSGMASSCFQLEELTLANAWPAIFDSMVSSTPNLKRVVGWDVLGAASATGMFSGSGIETLAFGQAPDSANFQYIFGGCLNLRRVGVLGDSATGTLLDMGQAFSGCQALLEVEDIRFKSIFNASSFSNCGGLTSLKVSGGFQGTLDLRSTSMEVSGIELLYTSLPTRTGAAATIVVTGLPDISFANHAIARNKGYTVTV